MKTGRIISGLAILLLLAACATTDTQPQTVEERAQARWDHVVAKDFGSAWAYYTPGFRMSTPREDFVSEMRRRPVEWLEAAVESAACEDDRCTVVSQILYHVPSAGAGLNRLQNRRRVEESWIRLDGQWWFAADH